METFDSNAIQMELKYCERCGALWLRLRESDLVYCASCTVILAGIARGPRFLQPRGASSRRDNAGPERTSMFWSERGNA